MYYNGILLCHQKKNEIMPFTATCMDLEMIILSEVRKRETNSIHHLYVGSKTWQPMNISMKQKETHGHGEHTSGCQGEEGKERHGVGGWGSDVSYSIVTG